MRKGYLFLFPEGWGLSWVCSALVIDVLHSN